MRQNSRSDCPKGTGRRKRVEASSASNHRRGMTKRSPFIYSRDLDLWAYANAFTLDFSRPGKPKDIAYIEAFNCRLRSGMPERPRVHEPCRRPREVGDLA
jgi:hypothetical protein